MLINKIKISDTEIVDGFININLSSKFSPEVQQYEKIEDNFDLTSSDVINPIIDFEKVKLSPVEISGETNISVDALNFKLHFIETGGTVGWSADSSLLTSIGFTESDIYNRRKKIAKTFVRLSFYDSNNMNTQNLLFYSTIYMDENAIYAKYVKDGAVTTDIRTEFMAENPQLSSKIKSFEGHNIYLFKNDIPKTTGVTIYMRADYNSAVDGRSLLLTTDKPSSKAGFTIPQLYSKMFSEVTCMYDSVENKYVYSFVGKTIEVNPDTSDKNIKKIINIDLYQAKVI
jgi:hypothetical protein